MKITLEFDSKPSQQYPTGYWYALASTNGSPDLDEDGATPLESVINLAAAIYEEWSDQKAELEKLRERLKEQKRVVAAARAWWEEWEDLEGRGLVSMGNTTLAQADLISAVQALPTA
jgi:hypothetical protein